jgi:ubiquinone/menaquinone biosynthesis C-methylase UbiE
MKRVVIPELLDSDAGSPAEIAAALHDLWRINAWFGGVGTSTALVRRVAERSGRRKLSLLDVAAGSGELAAAVRRRLRREFEIEIRLLDRSRAHLNGARNSVPDAPGFGALGRNAVVADALAMPFRDHAVDLVSSSLFLHHLESAEMVRFVDEALRVCRIAVLINDLRRSRLHLAAVYAGFPLFRSRLTRHDAPASVRRAYTIAELRAILKQAGGSEVEIGRHYLFRLGAIVWK